MKMKIELKNVGQRFRYEWIFRKIAHTFQPEKSYAILGPNGSGKSTLMKILSGHLSPSEGNIEFQNTKKIDGDDVHKHISFAAPYIDIIEEMTLFEIIDFHIKFKPLSNSLKINDLIEILGFQKSIDKEIRFFSSGMKQRLKLVLAICSDTPILLLDEPTTNLDAQGVAWYRQLMQSQSPNTEGSRLVIIASNIEHDYDFCDETFNILDYK